MSDPRASVVPDGATLEEIAASAEQSFQEEQRRYVREMFSFLLTRIKEEQNA